MGTTMQRTFRMSVNPPGALGRSLVTLVLFCAFNATTAFADVSRLGGKPNLNGIWEAMGTANWNLEAHPAEKIRSQWQLGALFAIPAGTGVVVGGKIPYKP